MKYIYYRKASSTYQKGIFISIKSLATILFVVSITLFYSMGLIEFFPVLMEISNWYTVPIFITLGILVAYFFELQMNLSNDAQRQILQASVCSVHIQPTWLVAR